MSSLLPILFGLQNGTTAIGGAESSNEPLGQVSKDQPKPSGLPLAPAFSKIFREQEEAAAFFNKLETLVSTQTEFDGATHARLTQKDFPELEAFVHPDPAEGPLGEAQAYRNQTFPELSVRPTSDSDILQDPASLLPSQFLEPSIAVPNNAVAERAQIVSREQPTSQVGVPSPAPTPIEGFQTAANALFQGSEFQPTSGDPLFGQVRQDIVGASDALVKAQISRPQVLDSRAIPQQVSLPKETELGFVPQPVSQESTEKHTSAVLNREGETITRTVATPAKDVLSGLEQAGRSVPRNETLRVPILQSPPSPASVQSHNVLSNHTPHTTVIQAEGLAGFTDRVPISQFSIRPVPGIPLVANDVSGSVTEHRTPVPIELNAESGLLGKADRVQNVVETSVRGVGLEASSGQGLGMGMNHSSNSQSGFQQSSFSHGQGGGLQALEERRPDLPAPALQRLQMDVQLSENNRVHLDVGVQNKHVYAGLVMDHAVLRNLAAQFVPQLENQLSRVDLELQEFSAEVREEHQQHADTMFHDPQSRGHQETGGHSQSESSLVPNFLNRYQEQGLHLVA